MPEKLRTDKSEKPEVSRLQKLRDRAKDPKLNPDMPPVECGEHLLEILWEIGPAMAAGAGSGPLTHEELRAWQGNTGVELQPWEARFLRRLSLDYLGELHRASKADCPPPWQESGDAKVVAASGLQDAMRALAKL